MKRSTLLRALTPCVCALVSICALSTIVHTPKAHAFCGVYVEGAGADLFNDATQVVLLRDGTQTVMTMQNRYEGPVKDFAMVIPVPVVLDENSVRTLHKEMFDHIDYMTSPRLVQYGDPCSSNDVFNTGSTGGSTSTPSIPTGSSIDVKHKFKAGEYQIQIVSAANSTDIHQWLSTQGYTLPSSTRSRLQAYVDQGMYFLFANIDPNVVDKVGPSNHHVLSPLQISYHSNTLSLPVRLGLANAKQEQDLVIYTLSPRGHRYEAVNRPNATIPTNIEVDPKVAQNFPAFYTALFKRTLNQNPDAIVTEYAWGGDSLNAYGNTCDPCPEVPDQPLTAAPTPEMLNTLGADLTPTSPNDPSWTVTRLHTRLSRENTEDDIIFRTAEGIYGGRADHINNKGELIKEAEPEPNGYNAFQARYIINYDGNQCGSVPKNQNFSTTIPAPSLNTRGDSLSLGDGTLLSSLVREDIPSLNLVAGQGEMELLTNLLGACSSLTSHNGSPSPAPLTLLGLTTALGWILLRRRS